MSELLRVENISYCYDSKYLALNGASVAFCPGERVAVLGGNGAGKSTFFLCCNGVLRPQSGKIFYKGREMTRAKKDILALRQAVGLVFQDPDSQIIAGSVESEVSFGPMNLRLPRDEVACRVDQALAQMNLCRYRDYAPQYLSGGEKKRVSIADILAMQPEMILLDEPTASLDPRNVDVLERILTELNREGMTIVISTHDVNFAYRIAQRAVVFAQGEIIADADVEDVFASAEILDRAGLRKPLLYEMFEVFEVARTRSPLRNQGLDPRKTLNPRRPRTVDEFRAYLERN